MNTLLRECVSDTHDLHSIDGIRIGKIVDNTGCRQVFVDFPGNQNGPVEARLSSSVMKRLRHNNQAGRDVLLAFENNDPRCPVIIDTLHSLLDEISEQSEVHAEAEKPDDVTIDGKRITFDAKEEIVLNCGKASITLTKAGKVLIRGDYLLSRSSGVNQIKGGSVQIN